MALKLQRLPAGRPPGRRARSWWPSRRRATRWTVAARTSRLTCLVPAGNRSSTTDHTPTEPAGGAGSQLGGVAHGDRGQHLQRALLRLGRLRRTPIPVTRSGGCGAWNLPNLASGTCTAQARSARSKGLRGQHRHERTRSPLPVTDAAPLRAPPGRHRRLPHALRRSPARSAREVNVEKPTKGTAPVKLPGSGKLA